MGFKNMAEVIANANTLNIHDLNTEDLEKAKAKRQAEQLAAETAKLIASGMDPKTAKVEAEKRVAGPQPQADDLNWAELAKHDLDNINMKLEDKKSRVEVLVKNIELCTSRIEAAQKILAKLVGVNSVAARELGREASTVITTQTEKRSEYQGVLEREKRILAEFQRQHDTFDHERLRAIQKTARLVAEMNNSLR
jgi:hypothetical protein